jgi:hypothetical protein
MEAFCGQIKAMHARALLGGRQNDSLLLKPFMGTYVDCSSLPINVWQSSGGFNARRGVLRGWLEDGHGVQLEQKLTMRWREMSIEYYCTLYWAYAFAVTFASMFNKPPLCDTQWERLKGGRREGPTRIRNKDMKRRHDRQRMYHGRTRAYSKGVGREDQHSAMILVSGVEVGTSRGADDQVSPDNSSPGRLPWPALLGQRR